jgi:ribokinase
MPLPLVVVGSINADLYVEIDRLPLPGETISGANAAMRPGGKGANQAGAAARLGYPTQLIAQLGDDAYGPVLLQALILAGVDLAGVASVPGPSGQALILLQGSGENSIVIVGGANQVWRELPASAQRTIAGGGALLLQREIPEAVSLGAARCAQQAQVPVVLDAGGVDAALAPELLQLVSCLSPNESELARLTGMPTDSDEAVLAAARHLKRHGVASVLVKLGSRGALLLTPDGEVIHHDAYPVTVVDTTGAGDCFTAAYAVAMLEGRPPAKRLRFACAAAALCVGVKGALPSMPDREAVNEFLRLQVPPSPSSMLPRLGRSGS